MGEKNITSADIRPWNYGLARTYTSALGLGFIPKAPGTFGSLLGLVLGFFLHHVTLSAAITILIILSIISIMAIRVVEKNLQQHDPSEIVIDEVIGQAITVLFISPNLTAMIMAFGLFRLFDIWKPGPVGWVDQNMPGAFGTMADDFTAAFIAGIIAMQIAKFLP